MRRMELFDIRFTNQPGYHSDMAVLINRKRYHSGTGEFWQSPHVVTGSLRGEAMVCMIS